MTKKVTLFDGVNATVLLVVSLLCVLPFLHVLAVSLSNGNHVVSGDVFLLPQGFNLEVYKYILNNPRLHIASGLANSFLYMGIGTVFAVLLTFLTAYPLSRKKLKGRYAIMLVFLFTWIFEAGLIPNFLVLKSLGFVNSMWVMIIPAAINTFLLIVTRSFLDTLPDELEEAAFIDGANDFQIMWRVFLPLCKPVLATIAVFYAVGIWNSFLFPLIYLQDKGMHPIQLVLYTLVINPDPSSTNLEHIKSNGYLLLPQNIKAAAIFLAVFPILFVYPLAQKYFTKGFLIGSVKG